MVTEQTSISVGAPPTTEDQQSEMPPMGMPPQEGMAPRDREAPPYAGAPRYGGQPPPYQAAQQPYPPPTSGAFPPQGFPPYGFPPHMFPPGGPTPYGQGHQPFLGGFPGPFPPQHARLPQESKLENFGSHHQQQQQKNPRPKSKAPRKPQDDSEEKPLITEMMREAPPKPPIQPEMPTAVEPMRSAFHFYVDDMQDKLRPAAVEEVKRSTKEKEVDLFLLNTSLNSRLMKEWEDSERSVRDVYLNKEEEDQKRFMKEDEIASRHCATLTARARSPRHPGSHAGTSRKPREQDESASYETGDFTGEDVYKKRGDASPEEKGEFPAENGESPTKKIRTEEV